jgi:hypothetical protein
MADTPDTAQRLAEIRQGWTNDGRVINSDMGWALDYIDALTAQAAQTKAYVAELVEAVERVGAERDALRAALDEANERMGRTVRAWIPDGGQ